LAALAAAAALSMTGLVAVAAPAQAAETISCSTATGADDFYQGDSASKVYDKKFQLGHAVVSSVLNGYIPQGLGTWVNWGGRGKDLALLTAYNDSRSYSVLIGLVPGGGQTKIVRLPKSHVGGIAVVRGHLFVSGPGKSIQRFNLAELRTKLRTGGTLRVRSTRTLTNAHEGDSFLAPSGNTLYAGSFSEDHRKRMYRYTVAADGSLHRVGSIAGGWIEVPQKTQGLVVTPTHYIFSTSFGSKNRGNIYVVRRGHQTLDAAHPADLTCFRAPSMSEGITRTNGTLYLTFESGSFKYRTDPCDKVLFEGDCTRNIIKNLHRANLAALTSMT
jgi:hypothetical protein